VGLLGGACALPRQGKRIARPRTISAFTDGGEGAPHQPSRFSNPAAAARARAQPTTFFYYGSLIEHENVKKKGGRNTTSRAETALETITGTTGGAVFCFLSRWFTQNLDAIFRPHFNKELRTAVPFFRY